MALQLRSGIKEYQSHLPTGSQDGGSSADLCILTQASRSREERGEAKPFSHALYTEKGKFPRSASAVFLYFMGQNYVIPTRQSLEEMKRITMTMIDLDQSNFIPWGLGEEPLFSDATT